MHPWTTWPAPLTGTQPAHHCWVHCQHTTARSTASTPLLGPLPAPLLGPLPAHHRWVHCQHTTVGSTADTTVGSLLTPPLGLAFTTVGSGIHHCRYWSSFHHCRYWSSFHHCRVWSRYHHCWVWSRCHHCWVWCHHCCVWRFTVFGVSPCLAFHLSVSGSSPLRVWLVTAPCLARRCIGGKSTRVAERVM